MSDPSILFRPEEYYRPRSVEEAVTLLARHGDVACPIGGGTDLLVERNPRIKVLVDLTCMGLDYLLFRDGWLAIGAATLIADLGTSPVLCSGPYRLLAQAARELGTPQIRNMATLGGNICRPSPSADCAPPLLVLDAVLNIAGLSGTRRIRIDQFFKGVREDALRQGEIVTEILLPDPPRRAGTAFIKKGRVAAGDLSMVSVAVSLCLSEKGVCENVRIGLGSVAPIPLRVKNAEGFMEGRAPDQRLFVEVARQASEEIEPISDIRASAEYRRTLSRVLVERALREALARIG